MKRIAALVAIVGLAAAYGVALPPPAKALSAEPPPVAVRGAIHVHTRRSDGTGSADDIAAAASRAGLAFVIFTDHGTADRDPEPPSYRAGVLCIDAVEISTDGGHVIALGLSRAPFPLAGLPRDVVEDVVRFGGFAIAAHPGSAKEELRWTDWDAPIGGLEWLNADSEWRDESAVSLTRALLAYPLRRAETLASVLDRPVEVLRRWDELTRHRRIVGIAGADAHARIGAWDREPYRNTAFLHMPSYEQIFRTFSVSLPGLVLSGEAAADAAAVLDAIRHGRVYSSIDALAGPAVMTATATSGRYQAHIGGELPLDGPVNIHVASNAPSGTRITLIRDGVPITSADGPSLTHETPPEPAVYRIELEIPDGPGGPPVPWIVANPIYVGRSADAATPPPAVPNGRDVMVVFPGSSTEGWGVETSARARGAFDVVSALEGNEIAFRYALAGARSDSPFVALRVPPGPSLPAYERVVFTARADRPMRLSVQLRASGGGEEARWSRSVYLDDTPRETSLAFADLIPRDANPRLDLAAVDSILFVVDTVNTRIGTSGQVWLDDIKFER